MAKKDVVVWEWQMQTNIFHQYESLVSNYLETAYRNDPEQTVDLTHAEPMFYTGKIVDFKSMTQYNRNKGTTLAVRRSTYSGTSVAARGVEWQWTGDDGHWRSYDFATMQAIETGYEAHVRQQGVSSVLDLSMTRCRMPYSIDYGRLVQIRNATGFERPIRRTCRGDAYSEAAGSAASGTTSGGASGPSTSRPVVQHTGGASASQSASQSATTMGGHHSMQIVQPPMVHSAQGLPHPNSQGPFGMFPASQGQTGTQQGFLPNTLGHYLQTQGFASATQGSVLNPYGFGAPQGQQLPSNTTSGPTLNPSLPKISGSVSNTKRPVSDKKPLDVVLSFCHHLFNPPANETCSICLCDLADESEEITQESVEQNTVIQLLKCKHRFHEMCMLDYYKSSHKGQSIECPVCKEIYGTKEGICPQGTMTFQSIHHTLPGHPNHGTILIKYEICSGIQGSEHPTPGNVYRANGFPRYCYLPDSDEGRLALKLLIVAWHRRLTFTVGTSLTNGIPDSVIWNEIHHKTDHRGNHNGHGYPDPAYLDCLLAELKAQGIEKEHAELVDLS